MLARVLLSLALALGLLVIPSRALACSWVPPTLAEAAIGADLIFVGEVVETDDWYRATVLIHQTFRGAVTGVVTLGPEIDPNACGGWGLVTGGRYLFGLDTLTDALFVNRVWLQLDGESVIGLYIVPPTTSVDELFSILSELPDAAMAPARTSPSAFWPLPAVAALLLLTGAAWHWRNRSRWPPLLGWKAP